MQKLYRNCLAAAAALVVVGIASPKAEAMTISAPAGLNAAIHEANPTQEVAYNCRRVWRCGSYGCGWRRACYWSPGQEYGYSYRSYSQPYSYGYYSQPYSYGSYSQPYSYGYYNRPTYSYGYYGRPYYRRW